MNDLVPVSSVAICSTPAIRVLPGEVVSRPLFLGINISVDYKHVAMVIDPECHEVDETALPCHCTLPAVNVPAKKVRIVMVPVLSSVSVESGLF